MFSGLEKRSLSDIFFGRVRMDDALLVQSSDLGDVGRKFRCWGVEPGQGIRQVIAIINYQPKLGVFVSPNRFARVHSNDFGDSFG
jgi:hypothetical protein